MGERETPRDRNTITPEELSEISGTNLYQVVQQARPLWLNRSGSRARSILVPTETVVVTEGRYFGGLGSLRQLPVTGVRSIRRLTGSDVVNTFPSLASGRHVEAAIVVEFGNPDR